MTCRNTLTDLLRFSSKDLARIEEPFTHHLLGAVHEQVRGFVTMEYNGVRYRSDISVPAGPDIKNEYADAVMAALRDIYRRLPLLEPHRPWHWHEFD